jgi:hypothetical protein
MPPFDAAGRPEERFGHHAKTPQGAILGSQAGNSDRCSAESVVLRFVFYTLVFSMLMPIGLGGCGGGGSSSPAVASAPTPLTSPLTAGLATPAPGTIYLGGFINPSGSAYGNTPSNTEAFETQIGRKLALDLQFSAFGTKFGNLEEQNDYANGRIPIFSWNCGATNAEVAAGAVDSTLLLQADAVKTYGWPVFIRYLWDMNLPATNFARTGCYDPSTDQKHYFSPTEFIAAWTHVRQIFAQAGVTNAIWLWTVSATGTNPLAYYPGPGLVDWVGFDSYDLTNTSLSATLQPMYSVLTPLNKPLMVSETGAGEAVQTAFFTGAAQTLQTQFPLVKGFVYYDGIGTQDWRIAPAALPAFTTFAKSSYMEASYAAP